MRISTVTMAYSPKLLSKKFSSKNSTSKNLSAKNNLSKNTAQPMQLQQKTQSQLSNQNITFGKIDPENREKILANLPIHEKDPQMQEYCTNYSITNMDKIAGATVKWGGEGNPKGLIYAELNQEHVRKSCMKWLYEDTEIEHLEDEDNLRDFVSSAEAINKRENPDGTRIKREPQKPSEPEPEPYDVMKELFEASLGW